MKYILIALLIATTFSLQDNPGHCVWADFQPVEDAMNACEAEFQKDQFVNSENIKKLFNAWRPFSNKCLGTHLKKPLWNCYMKAAAFEKALLKLVSDVNNKKSQGTIAIDTAVILSEGPGFSKSCFPQTFLD